VLVKLAKSKTKERENKWKINEIPTISQVQVQVCMKRVSRQHETIEGRSTTTHFHNLILSQIQRKQIPEQGSQVSYRRSVPYKQAGWVLFYFFFPPTSFHSEKSKESSEQLQTSVLAVLVRSGRNSSREFDVVGACCNCFLPSYHIGAAHHSTILLVILSTTNRAPHLLA